MSSSSGPLPKMSTYIVPSSGFGSTLASMPILARRSSRKSAATSASSSSSSSVSWSARRFRRTRTTASCPPIPRKLERGSWRISTSTSCSPTPRRVRATSTACSTLGPLAWICSTALPTLWSRSRFALAGGPLAARTLPGRSLPTRPRRARGRAAPSGLLAALALLRRSLGHRGHQALLLGLVVLRCALGQLLRSGTALQHEVLLPDLPAVRRRPVHDQTRREEDAEHPEHQGHELQQGLLLLARGAWRARLLHLALLVVRRAEHEHREDVVRDPIDGAVPAVPRVNHLLALGGPVVPELGARVARLGRGAEQVHPQERGSARRPWLGRDLLERVDRLRNLPLDDLLEVTSP